VFTATAAYYDLVYGGMKDYAAEARTVAERVARECPGARTLLDVACGTGEHAHHLAAHGLAVDGIDLDPNFVEIARRKHPAGRIECADMCAFDLGRTYDAVTCMFSSIGYVRTLDRLTAAFARFRAHLAPGGIVLVEPWFAPDAFQPGRVDVLTREADGVRLCRMSHASVEGRLSRIHFEYLIGEASGIRRADEDHVVGLFTVDETLASFRAAGLEATHEPGGSMGRGLYVARLD